MVRVGVRRWLSFLVVGWGCIGEAKLCDSSRMRLTGRAATCKMGLDAVLQVDDDLLHTVQCSVCSTFSDYLWSLARQMPFVYMTGRHAAASAARS